MFNTQQRLFFGIFKQDNTLHTTIVDKNNCGEIYLIFLIFLIFLILQNSHYYNSYFVNQNQSNNKFVNKNQICNYYEPTICITSKPKWHQNDIHFTHYYIKQENNQHRKLLCTRFIILKETICTT